MSEVCVCVRGVCVCTRCVCVCTGCVLYRGCSSTDVITTKIGVLLTMEMYNSNCLCVRVSLCVSVCLFVCVCVCVCEKERVAATVVGFIKYVINMSQS